jgi:hypothetical protein
MVADTPERRNDASRPGAIGSMAAKPDPLASRVRIAGLAGSSDTMTGADFALPFSITKVARDPVAETGTSKLI